jgi:hypothetical protein
MANARQQRVSRRQHLALLAKFLGDPEGRRYFYDLLASAHAFSTSFATNALSMAFREGERNFGIRLLADIVEASPDAYLLMLKEANDERRQQPQPESDAGTNSDSEPGTDS